MKAAEVNAFFTDPNLSEMTDLFKTTNDLLDVIKLGEVQHSDALAWCMNPNEGHGQGDSVIKDFLLAAHTAFETSGLREGAQKLFFGRWTPGRIANSSFGSAFIIRELGIDIDSTAKKKGRLDLFLLDPQNKLLVAIENKAGATLNAHQLDQYVKAVNERFKENPLFATYAVAFVVLDRHLQDYDGEYLLHHGRGWVLLDYSWLKESADRARRQLRRGNNAAQLLVSYCEKQTDWKNPDEGDIDRLAATLADTHRGVVTSMRAIEKMPFHLWQATSPRAAEFEIGMFYFRNTQLCKRLLRENIISGVLQSVRKRYRGPLEHLQIGKTSINIAPPAAVALMRFSSDPRWPTYANLYRDPSASRVAQEDRFKLRIGLHAEHFDPETCDANEIQEIVKKRFGSRLPQSLDHKWLTVAADLKADEAVARLLELVDQLQHLMLGGQSEPLVTD